MGLTVSIDPGLTALLRALGVLDADERVDASWFEDPIAAVGRILSNPAQRAGLFDLLDQALPPDTAASPPGASWYPLLDRTGRGNVYMTVDGDIIGVAGQLATPAGGRAPVSGGLRIPLVDAAGSLTAIAGTAAGPLELTLDVGLDPGGAIGAVHISATLDADRGAAIVVTLVDVDVGAGPETLVVSSADLGRDLVRAVETLVREALASVTGADERLARVVEHLLGAVGLDGDLPALALEQLAEDPGTARDWLAGVAADPADLAAWFAHVAGLLGAPAPSSADPLVATLIDLGGVRLDLRAEVRDGELRFSLALAVPGDRGSLEAGAVLLAVPLGGAPLRIVPEASVSVRAPLGPAPLVDAAPTVRVGSLAGGLRFDGTALAPELTLVDVTLDGTVYPTLDLTSASAVVEVATGALQQALEDALGTTGPARALLALLGLLEPRGDPRTPHALDIAAFAQAPTRALAELHRTVLADPAHGWEHMLAELGALLGLGGAVAGAGSPEDPWRIAIAEAGPALALDLAAWDAREATTPAGEHRLRLGLQTRAKTGPWASDLRMELLGFDLRQDAPAAVRLIGEQQLSVTLAPVPAAESPSGILVTAGAVRAVTGWSPGAPMTATLRIEDVRVTADGGEAGPLTLVFPAADSSAADLGLGAAIDELVELLRLLARHALLAFGGDGMAALGELLGISGEEGWPLLELTDPADLGSIAARPADALRAQLRSILTGVGARGDPFADRALRTLAGLVRDQVPRADQQLAPRLDVTIAGAGTYAAPWAVPLATLGDERVELLAWLDPDGPPASWAQALVARVVGAVDATTLAGLAGELAGFVPGLPDWPDELLHGDALDRLAAWLATGDGLAPLASQLPELPNWAHGSVLSVPFAEQPRDPDAIAQIAAQLGAWADEDGGRAVLLVGPAWTDDAVWAELLDTVEPGRPAGAHFDLRAGADPLDVTAVATHYTADLDDDGTGDVAALSAQLGPLVDRVLALTGRARVVLVAHGPAGIVARVVAAERREAVRGVVTLGTPHAGEPPAPLTDPALAEAVRLARALGGEAIAGTSSSAALDQLDSALDGLAGAPLPAAFALVPDGTANPVPGLAIGSALGGNLVALLSDALAARVDAAAADADRAPPTHVGLGLRLGLPFPDPSPGPDDTSSGLAVDAHVRLDAGRIRLDAAAPEPARPARAAHVLVGAGRPGGWLVGQPVGAGPRVRSCELAVSIVPASHGTIAAIPQLTLYDVVLGAARTDLVLGDAGLAPALDLLVDAFGAAAAGTLEAAVLDLAAAAGALVPDGAGGLRASRAGLSALATAPTSTLLARRDALLDALATAMGGALELALTSVPLTASYDRATRALEVRTAPELVLTEGLVATLDARLELRTLAGTLDAGLRCGRVSLVQDGATGRLTLSAPPWLDPLAVRPAPTPEALRSTLAPLVPRLALSSALSSALAGLLPVPGTIGPLDALLADPGAWLGAWDGETVAPLIQAAARALGLDDADGIALPGGFVLSASGAGTLRLELTGTLELDAAGDALAIALALDVDAARRVTPGGTLAFDVGLPGSFGRVAVAFALEATGVGLVVTPANGTPIRLLPQFGGFGDLLVAGARALLPHLLQAIVDELRPATGPPSGLLGAALALATALGIYGEDAEGFEAPERVDALVAMLEPGWLEAQSDPAALAARLAGLFGPSPLLQLPLGTITRTGDRLVWTGPAAGAALTVELALGAGGAAEIALAVDALDAGPLIVESARFGWDGTSALALRLRLDPGGELAFLTPELELGLADGALFAELQPLGAARQRDVSFTFAPTPAVAFTAGGALTLVTAWGVPLVGALLLDELETELDRRLWTGGPTARDVVEASGLVEPGSAPARIVAVIPPLPSMLLSAVQALASSVTLQVTPALAVSAVNEGGRSGLRLKGHHHDAAGDELTVSVRFGEADWLDDADAGVTLWLLRTDAALDPPIALDPGLDAIGIGGTIGRSGGAPLVDGPVVVGSAGGLLFASLDFLDAAGAPTVDVSGLGAAVEVADALIALASSDGDSFIQELLPPELEGPFSLAVEQRDGQDLGVHGGIGGTPGQVELTFPLDLDLTVVQIDELYLLMTREGGTTTAIAALSGGATLAPIQVVVMQVGLRVTIESAGVTLAFKPPDGVGIAIETDGLRAAGLLLVDEPRGRYVGAIELEIVDSFSISAIGIVTTQLPDGSPGFSLLFVISIVFPAPIPIGFNFFFAGAGGLLGLNRTVDLDRLTLGLRTGTADSILFPTDVLNRIDTIVRDLEEVFPIDEGHFLVAPMAMITWSTPALITAKVGLIIEIGEPFTLAILGTLRLALPTPDVAVVDLNVAFLGAIDLGASLLRFDASIYDSFIGYGDVRVSIEGDIAFRIAWGDQPDFVTSVGGFHPGYTPASSLQLPPMRLLTVSLLKGNPRLTLSTYFAVTTNTAQLGAKVELYVGAGGFTIEGILGFDLLVQFVPFHLDAHVYARLAVKKGSTELLSVALDFRLQGPTPWIASGKASFKVLFVSVTVSFDVTLGQEVPTSLPEVAVLPQVLDALEADEAWTAALGDSASALVLLLPPAPGELVIDAAGLLTVGQKVIPLATDFTLVGVAKPSDVTRVDVQELRLGAAARAADTSDVTDAFAPIAFQALSDADKLTAPAFEQRPAGVRSLSGEALTADTVLAHPVAYEQIVLDSAADPEPARSTQSPIASLFEALVPGGAIGASPLSLARSRGREKGSVLAVGPVADRFAVTTLGTLRPLRANGTTAPPIAVDELGRPVFAAGVVMSRTDAEQRRNGLLADGGPDGFQILPEAQLVG